MFVRTGHQWIMAKKAVKLDPEDGWIVGEVGPWAVKKPDRVKRYIQAARGARAEFLPPKGNGGATYIELYSGAGRSLIKGTSEIIEGSAVVAFNAGRTSGSPFSQMHLSDLEAKNSAALAQRLKANENDPERLRIGAVLSVLLTEAKPRAVTGYLALMKCF
jgi:three-Cys-motif partner protein